MLGIKLEETRVYREAKEIGIEQGIERGREEEALDLVTLLIAEKLSPIAPHTENAIAALSLDKLRELAKALLHLETIEQLTTWLTSNSQP